MKIIIAAVTLLMGSAAIAQTAKPALFKVDFNQPRSAAVPALYSDSVTAVVAENALPAEPAPALASAVSSTISVARPTSSTEFRPFFTSKTNRTLVATEFWSRILDAYSTRKDLTNACNCYHESSRLLGVKMSPVFRTSAGAYSYSLGIAGTYSFISAKLWDASKNHPNHARLLRTLSRALPVSDSSMELSADASNLSLKAPLASKQ